MMDLTTSLLVTCLHHGIGGIPYVTDTAVRLHPGTLDRIEAAGLAVDDEPRFRAFLWPLLPVHCRGTCIVRITPVLAVVQL